MSQQNDSSMGLVRASAIQLVRQRARNQAATRNLQRPSLNRPSRPITPRSSSRQMFDVAPDGTGEYLPHARPNTAFKIDPKRFSEGLRRVGSVPKESRRNHSVVSNRRVSSSQSRSTSTLAQPPAASWNWANSSSSSSTDAESIGHAEVLRLNDAASHIISTAASNKAGARS